MRGLARALGRGRVQGLVIVAVALAALVSVNAAVAQVSQRACDRRNNNTYQKLIECIRLDQVRAHQAALQEIADANGGNRFSGFSRLRRLRRLRRRHARGRRLRPRACRRSTTSRSRSPAPRRSQQTAPGSITYVEGVDFGPITQTDPGDVTAAGARRVDLQLGLGNTSTSGCEATDFAGFPAGNIALLQRGTCTFELKAENAAAAGAVGIVIFNQGNTAAADRNNIPAVTLTANNTSGIPVLGTTYALGVTLVAARRACGMRVFANTLRADPAHLQRARREDRHERRQRRHGRRAPRLGAGRAGHQRQRLGLAPPCSRPPSSSPTLKPQNTVRFAWWGAEESGLVGSTNYVNGLSPAEKDRIALYLNFDMVGSPNYIFMMQDADQSSFVAPVAVPPGSTAIEDLFESYYTLKDEPYDDSAFDGRSDYQAFIVNGIPAGGLFTGAEVRKTAEQAAIWGGTVGAQFDPCYHAACDTFANNNDHALSVNADAIGFAMLTFAYSTETVNGVPGKRVPGQGKSDLPAPAGSQGTFVP